MAKQNTAIIKTFKINREINDEDLWAIEIKGFKKLHCCTKSSLKAFFELCNINFDCIVKVRFINKSGLNVEKY